MTRAALALAILLAVAAATAAALIVLPAPSKSLALLAIVTGEKSLVIIGAALVSSVLALFVMRPGTRLVAMLTVLVSLGALIVGLIPPAQALRLAGEQRVDLNLERYLHARIDTEGPVPAQRTVVYATVDGRSLGLDVYGPQHPPAEPTRAILVIHGGSWSAGDKGDASLFSQRLAEHEATVFDVAYRTAPQPNWKTATGDIKCAIGWLKQHASTPDWHIDPKKITLLGRSAGGHLALLAAYTPGDARLPPSCDAPDTTVESVVSYYAGTDLVWAYAHPASTLIYDSCAKLRGFVGGPPETTGDLYRLLSPTERVTARSPRTLLIHGGRDQFIGKQHVDLLTERLHAAGVRYDTLIIPYAQHAFDFVFGGLSEQIAEAVVLRFLAATPAASTGPSMANEEAAAGSNPAAKDGGAVAGDSGALGGHGSEP